MTPPPGEGRSDGQPDSRAAAAERRGRDRAGHRRPVYPDGVRPLWFECDAANADKIAWETSDAFNLIAMLIAMRRGWPLTVKGPLSTRLYYSTTMYVMELPGNLIEGTRKVAVAAPSLFATGWGGSGVLGFMPPLSARLASAALHNPVLNRTMKLVVRPRSLYTRWLTRRAAA
jgi:hypothetical protein